MIPTEAINTLCHDDLDVHTIGDWKFYICNKRGRDAGPPERQKQYHTHYAPLILDRWARTLVKAVEFVPKTTQAAARTDMHVHMRRL